MTTETQKYLPGIIKGYKATDANICCRGLQYTPGEWQEVGNADELIKCGGNGLHFCLYPSGPWAFYSEAGSRLWECEAEYVLDEPVEPGADAKRVCRRLRLVKEIIPDGYRNTGDRNTGDRNTGDWNTGDWNTGNGNTGNWNTGNRNTGNRNTGNWNTGNGNTGNGNTGNWNTGNGNTGNGNAGNGNTGNGNTGNWNTGNGNATSYCSGFFCTQEPKVLVFDTQTKLTVDEFTSQFPEYLELCNALHSQEPIPLEPYARIPGITQEKLTTLHQKHLAGKTK